MTRLRWMIAPVASLIAVLAIACGGGDDNPSGANLGSPGGSGAAVSQELDLAQAANQLKTVDSFRYNLKMKIDVDGLDSGSEEDAMGAAFLALLGNIEMEGAFVGPDSYAASTQLFGMDIQMVQIGAEAWTNDGTGWVESTPDADFGMMGGGSPADMAFDMLPQEVLEGADISMDDVNGQDTIRYSFDKESLTQLATTLGEDVGDLGELDEMELDVWVTTDGVPVKMTMNVVGESEGSRFGIGLEFNITDLNDPGIKIDRPI